MSVSEHPQSLRSALLRLLPQFQPASQSRLASGRPPGEVAHAQPDAQPQAGAEFPKSGTLKAEAHTNRDVSRAAAPVAAPLRPRRPRRVMQLPDHIGAGKSEADFERASRVENVAGVAYQIPREFLADPDGLFRTVGRLAARLQIVDRKEWLLFIRALVEAAEYYRAVYTAQLPPERRRWSRIRRLPPYMVDTGEGDRNGNRIYPEQAGVGIIGVSGEGLA